MSAPAVQTYVRLSQRGRELAAQALANEVRAYERVVRAGSVRKVRHQELAEVATAATIAEGNRLLPDILARFGDTPELQTRRRAELVAS